MDLSEYQAKNVLQQAGIPVPDGVVASNTEHALQAFSQTGFKEAVVKAQIRAGGRADGHFLDASGNHANALNASANTGGIRFAASIDDVENACNAMLKQVLVTEQTGPAGEYVDSVYIESKVPVKDEFYLSISVNRELGQLAFLASRLGGTGVEHSEAAQFHRFPVDIDNPAIPADLTTVFSTEPEEVQQLISLFRILMNTFIDKDAALIELNPFGFDKQGQLVALDARIVWDDNAVFRQGHEEQMAAYDHLSESEFKAVCLGFNYIKLDGNIGMLATGAGLAMATLDAIADAGGSPANFLDLPPASSVADIAEALSIVRIDTTVNVMVINVIGGGIMRCDAIADALLLSHEKHPITIPVVIRLAGTNAEMAMQRIQSTMPETHISNNLADAARLACKLAHSQKAQKHMPALKSWWQRARNKTAVESS